MATIKWSTPAALASAIASASMIQNARQLGSEIDNETNKNLFADWELNISYNIAPSGGDCVGLYFVQAVDGTNYALGDASSDPNPNTWVGNFMLNATTAQQTIVLRQTTLPPFKFKPLIKNLAKHSSSSGNNSLLYRTYNQDVA